MFYLKAAINDLGITVDVVTDLQFAGTVYDIHLYNFSGSATCKLLKKTYLPIW